MLGRGWRCTCSDVVLGYAIKGDGAARGRRNYCAVLMGAFVLLLSDGYTTGAIVAKCKSLSIRALQHDTGGV